MTDKKVEAKAIVIDDVDDDDYGDVGKEGTYFLAEFTQQLYNAMVPVWNKADARPKGVHAQHLATAVSLACWQMIRESAPNAIDAGVTMSNTIVRAVSLDSDKEFMGSEIKKAVCEKLGLNADDVTVRQTPTGGEVTVTSEEPLEWGDLETKTTVH